MPLNTADTHLLIKFIPAKGTESAYKAALLYVAVEGEPGYESPLYMHPFITFGGEPGRGKTHLALGIGWHWLGQDRGTVKYWQVEALLDQMRGEFDNPPVMATGAPMMTAFQMAKMSDLLILDDLGAEKSTPWAEAKLDELVDYRYINDKCTVFTTNLAPKQLQPRISSRIREGVTVTLEGPDYRELIAKRRGKETNR
jgi:DNA replication protein DnaC